MAITIHGAAPLLQVFDMPTSIRFYRDVLGFETVIQSQPELKDDCDWILLRLNEAELMLNTVYEREERPPVPDPDRVTIHGDTTLYFKSPDIDEIHHYLKEKGIDTEAPITTKYGFRAFSLLDPDGYGITFHQPVK